jgi:hypothetical protein
LADKKICNFSTIPFTKQHQLIVQKEFGLATLSGYGAATNECMEKKFQASGAHPLQLALVLCPPFLGLARGPFRQKLLLSFKSQNWATNTR